MLTLYFSGTGNSKYVAELFAADMGGDCFSIEETLDFSSLIAAADTVAFVYPVYASRVPRILKEFVQRHQGDLLDKQLVILATQMGFSGDGARCFTDLLERNTYCVLYAEHITMPNNINNLFIFPRTGDRRVKRQLAAAQRKVRRISENIRAGVAVRRGFNQFSRLLGLMQGASAPRMEQLAKASVQIGEECIGCGQCVKRCPMHNLVMENGKAKALSNCTECYRCINLCPAKAIRIYFKKKVGWQYHGPNGGKNSRSA